jgi:hypothetical protein
LLGQFFVAQKLANFFQTVNITIFQSFCQFPTTDLQIFCKNGPRNNHSNVLLQNLFGTFSGKKLQKNFTLKTNLLNPRFAGQETTSRLVCALHREFSVSWFT